MKVFIKSIFVLCFIGIFQTGYCSDSTYIRFAWGGEMNKPYYEFLFYRSGSGYPDQHGNPFVLISQLKADQFSGLKHLLIDDFAARSKNISSHLTLTYYFIGYFKGNKLLSFTNILDQNDLVMMSRLMKNYFKQTSLSDEVNSHWESLFERLQIQKR